MIMADKIVDVLVNEKIILEEGKERLKLYSKDKIINQYIELFYEATKL